MILLMHHFVKMTCLHGAVVQSSVTGTYLTSNGDVKKAQPHIWCCQPMSSSNSDFFKRLQSKVRKTSLKILILQQQKI